MNELYESVFLPAVKYLNPSRFGFSCNVLLHLSPGLGLRRWLAHIFHRLRLLGQQQLHIKTVWG